MGSQFSEFFQRHERIFVLTGAGISAPSGIPVYRDAEGHWQHSRPMEYNEFVSRPEARQRYWTRSAVGWQRFLPAQPNAAHRALARLESLNKISITVTQNVDGLHQKSGSKNVIELHGSLYTVSCIECGFQQTRRDFQQHLLADNPVLDSLTAGIAPDGDAQVDQFDWQQILVPDCLKCGGVVKPDVVFYGENVPAERVQHCFDELSASDALLVVGSSLMVFSGFRFVRAAHQQGIEIAAINLGKTRGDELINLKIERDCVQLLPELVRQIDEN
ncbi:MAG: NAD-dependent protein deacetylase [Pseudomonadota bacterium]